MDINRGKNGESEICGNRDTEEDDQELEEKNKEGGEWGQ